LGLFAYWLVRCKRQGKPTLMIDLFKAVFRLGISDRQPAGRSAAR
jgi:hypothetical protein